ncbi:hypothetical protein D1007_28776 [Hordeum vulgare]|nr:hypothetical protein D1007_28776 [Hordeum vulgare]
MTALASQQPARHGVPSRPATPSCRPSRCCSGRRTAVTTGCMVAVCRPRTWDDGAGADGGWTTTGCGSYLCIKLIDIAFCNGELYGVSRRKLYRLVMDRSNNAAPVITSADELTTRPGRHGDAKYIFKLGGKLAIAVEI